MPSASQPSDGATDRYGYSTARGEPIGKVAWDEVYGRLNQFWIPKDAPHHSIIAQTRGGKSYLIGNGILPMHADRKVLIIDVKGDDPTFAEIGKPVRKIPKRGYRTFNDWLSEEKPREHWYRLIVSDDWTAARSQVGKALTDCYNEQDWTIVLDETRALTDPQVPGLGLRAHVEQLWLRGGSKGICVVAATQGPRWVPKSFYEQSQFLWTGRVEDEEAQKRLREIGGMEKHHAAQIKELPRHHFVYTDGIEEQRYRGITKVGE